MLLIWLIRISALNRQEKYKLAQTNCAFFVDAIGAIMQCINTLTRENRGEHGSKTENIHD